jgi:hypothetical protein
MSDEDELREREQTFLKDRRNQAKWYESLNLYAEAMKIYRSIKDDENIKRLSAKMAGEYTKNAVELEKTGKFQDAANLYYLIGDMEGVGRMKKQKPDLVIIYDESGGGLAQVAKELGSTESDESGEEYFSRMNPGDDFEMEEDENGTVREMLEIDIESPDEGVTPMGRKGVPVKMPKSVKKMRFCPYCGERINTKKNPKFCPFCGDELA